MTLISSIILDAFREGNILPLGRAPNPNQAAEALRLLNAIFVGVYGGDAGEGLEQWPMGNFGIESPSYASSLTTYDFTHPGINRRLIALNEEALTVYLSLYPQDGARMGIADPYGRLAAFPLTLDGNGRTIEGAQSILLDTNGLNQQWFFRADLGDWVRLTSKLEADEMPFPAEHDTFFIITLAMRLNPRYGRELDGQSAAIYKQVRREFVNRYLQSLPLEVIDDVSWPFMSLQSYNSGRAFSSNRAFDRGWVR